VLAAPPVLTRSQPDLCAEGLNGCQNYKVQHARLKRDQRRFEHSTCTGAVIMSAPTIVGKEHNVFGLSVRLSVRCPPVVRPSLLPLSVNLYFAWCDISVVSGEILMKPGVNVHHKDQNYKGSVHSPKIWTLTHKRSKLTAERPLYCDCFAFYFSTK